MRVAQAGGRHIGRRRLGSVGVWSAVVAAIVAGCGKWTCSSSRRRLVVDGPISGVQHYRSWDTIESIDPKVNSAEPPNIHPSTVVKATHGSRRAASSTWTDAALEKTLQELGWTLLPSLKTFRL